MRLHERYNRVPKAENALVLAMWEILDKNDLTNGEFIMAVSGASNRVLSDWAKATIRFERHGNYDTPGGEDITEEDSKDNE